MTLLVLVVTCIGTWAFGAAAPAVLRRLGLVDYPNARSSHVAPVPRGGGVACLLGVGMGAVVWAWGPVPLPAGPLVAGGLLGLLGLADDVRSLGPLPRLGVQAAVGGVVGWLPTGSIATAMMGAIVMTVIVNVVNFMDGINGITGLTMLAWGGCAMLSAVNAEVLEGTYQVVGALVAGSALGFLPRNLPRAQMFLGDSGSYFFGALVGATLIVSMAQPGSSVRSTWLLVAPLGVFLADAGWAIIKRAAGARPILHAHREHVYQRLVDNAGWSHSRTALLAAALAAFVGSLQIRPGGPSAVLASLCLLAAYLALPWIARRSEQVHS